MAVREEPAVSFVTVGERRLEFTWHGPSAADAPSIVFLHEGLGCVEMLRDIPARIAERTGCGALVYSRAGYGNSDSVPLPRHISFMHEEALVTLPTILAAFEIHRPILFGHSDGGSIALIYAGSNKPVRGLILEAPHVFVEDISVKSIAAAVENYEHGELKLALSRYHDSNIECAFLGWSGVWLNPEFRSWNIEEFLPKIHTPMLLIQGVEDEYGTLRQIEAIQSGCLVNVDTLILENCGHSPHREYPEKVLEVVESFVRQQLIFET